MIARFDWIEAGFHPVFKGLIDEVRVYQQPLSRREVRDLYQQDAASFDKDLTLFSKPRIETEILPFCLSEVTVEEALVVVEVRDRDVEITIAIQIGEILPVANFFSFP